MTAAAVHTVFRCVASWNRGSRRGCPTLGVAVSLLADRLRTTGRIYITLFGLAPTPLEAVQTSAFECRAASTPGRGRAMRSIATGFSPKLGQDLPMTAAATPRGRPQYAAQRDEIAPSASGDRCRSARKGWVFLCKVPLAPAEKQALTERPHSCHSHHAGRRQRKELRALPSSSRRRGWRRLAHSYGVQIPNWPTNFRAPGPKNCSAPLLRPTVSVRAPAKSCSNAYPAFERFRPLGAATGAARHSNRACRLQPAWSARWRNLVKQRELFDQVPTPAIARGDYFGRPRGFQSILLTQNG